MPARHNLSILFDYHDRGFLLFSPFLSLDSNKQALARLLQQRYAQPFTLANQYRSIAARFLQLEGTPALPMPAALGQAALATAPAAPLPYTDGAMPMDVDSFAAQVGGRRRNMNVNPNGSNGPGLASDPQYQGRRAKWVTKEELQRRRDAGVCLRCGRKGCRVALCPLAMAKREEVRVATVQAWVEPDSSSFAWVEPGKRVAPVQKRAQELGEARAEWEKDWQGARMIGEVFQAEALVNGLYFGPALIDHGSAAYALVSEDFTQACGLACFEVSPCQLTGVAGTGTICTVTYFMLDLDGHCQDRVFAYVVPGMPQAVILGMPWVQHQRVEYNPVDDTVWIGASCITVRGRRGTRRQAKG